MAVEQTTREAVLAGERFARDFAGRWQRAWNSREPEQVISLCTEDVVWDDPLTDGPQRGRQPVVEYLRSVWRTFPDLEFTWPEGPYASFQGVKLALHWRATATMLGPIEPQGFAATGRRVEADGVDLLELRDGLVSDYLGIFDARGMAQQLGVLPAPGSTGERLGVAAQRLLAGAEKLARRRRSRR